MGLFTNRGITFPPPQDLIPRRTARPNKLVTQETALHVSAVWAALRLRADLISTFPIDVYRRVGMAQVETPKPNVLKFPGGPNVSMMEWLYSSQMDLDRFGNCFGLISQRDSMGLPARIDLMPAGDVKCVMQGGALIGYRIKGVVFDVEDVWHERAYTIPGLDVGLSPVVYAAWSMGIFASLDQMINEWLDNATNPSAVMQNTQRTLNDEQAKQMKDRWRATVQNGDALILGADWTYTPFQAEQTGLNWIQAKQFQIEDIARFFNVPLDLLDISKSGGGGGEMKYSNKDQRNLQFLTFHLLPTIRRREETFSNKLLPQPRYVKFNTDALMMMDPTAQAALFASQIASGIRAPSEARELMNLPPLTPAQKAELQQVAQGGIIPPDPIPNPGAKGLSAQERAAVGYTPGQSDPSQHCSACCPDSATVAPVYFPERAQEPVVVHVHVPERSVEVHQADVHVHPAEVNFTAGDVNIDMPETVLRIVEEEEDGGQG